MTPTNRILIVDDDPGAIEVLEGALEGMGDLCFATGGEDALAFLTREQVDLILLDANMPGLDGFATCDILKQDYPDLPVIFVTAFGDEGYELRALKAGAVDFIQKPIKPPVVRARVGVHLKLSALSAEIRTLSDRDPLTGIANRRALDERLIQEWRRAARQQLPIGLLMIDVDYFKRYNDRYGHLQGDTCLRQVAEVLGATARRAGDLVARYGGEEFAILLAGSHLEAATALAEKVCAAVRAQTIPHEDSDAAPWVTVSIGAASAVPDMPTYGNPQGPAAPGQISPGTVRLPSAERLIQWADRGLYAAKAAGRDRVQVADPEGANHC